MGMGNIAPLIRDIHAASTVDAGFSAALRSIGLPGIPFRASAGPWLRAGFQPRPAQPRYEPLRKMRADESVQELEGMRPVQSPGWRTDRTRSHRRDG